MIAKVVMTVAVLLAAICGSACDWEPSDDPNCCQTRPSGAP